MDKTETGGRAYKAIEKKRNAKLDYYNMLEHEAMRCPVHNLLQLVIKARIAESIGAGGHIGEPLEGCIEEWAVQAMARSIEQLAGVPAPKKRGGYEVLFEGLFDGKSPGAKPPAIVTEAINAANETEDKVYRVGRGVEFLHTAIAEQKEGIWWLLEKVEADVSAAHASAERLQQILGKHKIAAAFSQVLKLKQAA
jgi:hypothetical protein